MIAVVPVGVLGILVCANGVMVLGGLGIQLFQDWRNDTWDEWSGVRFYTMALMSFAAITAGGSMWMVSAWRLWRTMWRSSVLCFVIGLFALGVGIAIATFV